MYHLMTLGDIVAADKNDDRKNNGDILAEMAYITYYMRCIKRDTEYFTDFLKVESYFSFQKCQPFHHVFFLVIYMILKASACVTR